LVLVGLTTYTPLTPTRRIKALKTGMRRNGPFAALATSNTKEERDEMGWHTCVPWLPGHVLFGPQPQPRAFKAILWAIPSV
jgi:hypothetical protein